MLVYVLFGGMIATTWVQIIKAILLLFGVTLLTLLVLSRFSFSPGVLYDAVVSQYGQAALEPGGLVSDPVDAVSNTTPVQAMGPFLGTFQILPAPCLVPGWLNAASLIERSTRRPSRPPLFVLYASLLI
jgi:Na+/proline symporter